MASFGVKEFTYFLYKLFVDIIIYSLILGIILGFLPNSWFNDYPLEPKSYEINIPDKVENWNNHLDTKSELLLNGVIVGPDSLAEQGDFIYTGLADGRLVEINKKTLEVREVTKFDAGTVDSSRIGGVRFHRDGHLYVVDISSGLYRVNVSLGEKELIVIKDINDKFGFDDLEFDPELNVVYITMVSTKWTLSRLVHGFLEYDDSGYIFAYNLDTKESVKLRTGTALANGIQLTKDKKHLLVVEVQGYKIIKISIENIHNAIKEKRLLNDNEIETFAELPGEGDNIRLDHNGNVMVGMFAMRTNGKIMSDHLSGLPFIRRAIGRMLYLFSAAIDSMNSRLFGSTALKTMAEELYSGQFLVKCMPKSGAVIKLDANSGQIIQILGSKQVDVSEAMVDSQGDLYFGSSGSPFLGRITKGDH